MEGQKTYIILSLAFVAFLAGAFVLSNNSKNKLLKHRKSLLENGVFSVGRITGWSISSGRRTGVDYAYVINQKTYKNSSGINDITQAKGYYEWDTCHKNDNFLVLYDKDNPKSSIMLFNKPVTNIDDFSKHRKEIENKRKNGTLLISELEQSNKHGYMYAFFIGLIIILLYKIS